MVVLFKPQEETSEGWRRWLGLIACLFGWHFGQILLNKPWEEVYQIKCATCKKIYIRKEKNGESLP